MSSELVTVDDRDPWDRQKGESAQAFAAFAHYRDTPPQNRSMLNTARHLIDTYPVTAAGKKRTTNATSVRTQLAAWSVQWSWQARIEAWEIAEDRRRRLERQARQRQMEERHLAGADRLLVAALLRAQGGTGPNGEQVQALSPNQIEDWSETATVLEKAVRIGRLTLGLPTDLMKSMDTWSTEDVKRLTYAIVDVMLPFIAEESQHEAVLKVQEVFLGWGRR